jgi:protein TonB
MQQSTQYVPSCFAPRWTWRSVLLSAAISLGIYLALPYLESVSSHSKDISSIRNIATTQLPLPPPPPLQQPERQKAETQPETPKPKLVQQTRQLTPMLASMNLSMALDNISGDFSVDFNIAGTQLENQIKQFVFEISDLDQPPRPVARLNPIYPSQARMRSMEGFVVVEFIVRPDGSVSDIDVTESQPGDLFTDAAVRAVSRWRFTPGSKQGQAVSTRVRQKITFSLN